MTPGAEDDVLADIETRVETVVTPETVPSITDEARHTFASTADSVGTTRYDCPHG